MAANKAEELLPIDRAVVYFERAKQLSIFSSGTSLELERLLREIFKALSYNNKEPKFYLLLGKIYKLNLDITSAMFCYRFILKQNQSLLAARKFLIELLVLKGKEYMDMGLKMKWKAKFTAARSCFDEALEYNRENYDLWIMKSVCHVHCGELPEAFEAISKVIRPNRELDAEIYILRAKINWGRGLTEQGNQDIRFAASINPNHPEVLGFIARSYARSELLYKEALNAFTQEKYKEALELVNHALHITSEDIKLYIFKSRIFRMLRELQSAYDAIMKAKSLFEEKYESNEFNLNLPPEIVLQTNLVLNEMAINYACEGNYHNAILLYNRILRTEESLNATLVAAHTKQFKDEQSQLSPNSQKNSILFNSRAVSHENFINYKYYMNRGDCYRALNQFPEAIYDYQKAIEIEPNDWTIRTKLSLTHYLVATSYFNSSSFIDADLELSKAINYNPKVSEYYSLRGKAKYYLSDFMGAHADYRKAVELDPNNNEIKMRLQQFEADYDEKDAKKSEKDKEKNQKELSIVGGGGGKKDRPKSPNRSGSPTLNHQQTIVHSAKELQAKAKQQDDLLDELLAKSRYKTDRSVAKVEVEQEDYVEMMLNHKKITKLPVLKLITSEFHEEERKKAIEKRRAGELYRQQLLDPSTYAVVTNQDNKEVLLPKILTKSNFIKAHVAKVDVHEKDKKIKEEFLKRDGAERNELWGIVDTAKEIVLAKAKAKLKAVKQKTEKMRASSISSSAANSQASHGNHHSKDGGDGGKSVMSQSMKGGSSHRSNQEDSQQSSKKSKKSQLKLNKPQSS